MECIGIVIQFGENEFNGVSDLIQENNIFFREYITSRKMSKCGTGMGGGTQRRGRGRN